MSRPGRQPGTARARRARSGSVSRGAISPGAVPTFAGNAQHTAIFDPAAQDLNAIHWSAPIDLNNTGALAHYGAPLVTAANTVLTPVKTASDWLPGQGLRRGGGSREIHAGDRLHPAVSRLDPDRTNRSWPRGPSGARLYYPGAGGTVFYIDESRLRTTPGAPVRVVFYTSSRQLRGQCRRLQRSDLRQHADHGRQRRQHLLRFSRARDCPGSAEHDAERIRAHRSRRQRDLRPGRRGGRRSRHRPRLPQLRPGALSQRRETLYVVVKSATTDAYGYLLGLDAATLATKYKVFLKDPRNGRDQQCRHPGRQHGFAHRRAGQRRLFRHLWRSEHGSRGFLLRFSGGP